MKPALQNPILAVLISFVPGLSIGLQGKRQLGLAAAVVVLLLFGMFFLWPALVTWYLFGAAYFGQMVYSAWLSFNPPAEKGFGIGARMIELLAMFDFKLSNLQINIIGFGMLFGGALSWINRRADVKVLSFFLIPPGLFLIAWPILFEFFRQWKKKPGFHSRNAWGILRTTVAAFVCWSLALKFASVYAVALIQLLKEWLG